LNWDAAEDREKILTESFPLNINMIVFDEIHKYKHWRRVVKGLFDKRGDSLKIMVTGSGKLDHYRHGGDSLQGRYHFYRLHPLQLNELNAVNQESLINLLRYGGFPEPFLLADNRESRRWSREYRTRIVYEELSTLEQVKDITSIEALALRLPQLVASPLSVNGLRQDLQVAHETVQRWLLMLENVYMIFRILPFGAPHIRAVKKEAKHYHYDWTLIEEPGIRFENFMACQLLAYCHYQQDFEGLEREIRFFRDIDLREVDFVLMLGKPTHFVECKSKQKSINPALKYLLKRFPDTQAVQVSLEAHESYMTKDGIQCVSAVEFLVGLF